MQKVSLAILIVAFGHLINAQVPFDGPCPEVKLMNEFDVDAYMGIWYEHSRYPFRFEVGRKCNYATYGNLGNKTISVINASFNLITGKPSHTDGYAKVLGPGQLAVVFRAGQSETDPNYNVLDTDYNNYAVVYSCHKTSDNAHTKNVWILARVRKPSSEIVAAAKKVMDDNNLPQSFLSDTDQNDCADVSLFNKNSSDNLINVAGV